MSTPTPRKKWSLARSLGVVGLSLVLLLAVAVGVLLVVKPWAPPIVVAEVGPTGQRITDRGMTANYYPAAGEGSHPTVLVVGGSDGGIGTQVDRTARALQEAGFTALALSYWGAPGQSEAMENLPLETFTTALDWLRAQPHVDPDRIAFVGASKGGEAAMVMAARTPELKAVVGYVPSHVVWAGFNLREPWKNMTNRSTWSADGHPVPYLPYTREYRGGPLLDLYTKSLESLPQHPNAIIPVENSAGPLLLVCGEQDTLWPSCPMARAIEERALASDGPPVTVLAYPDAGHFVSGPPGEPGSFDLTTLGGTQAGGEYALTDGWPRVLDFLRANLES